MGQSLEKFANGEQSDNIGPIIDNCYLTHFNNTEKWNLAQFCRAVCQTVEDINKKLGCTQLRVPEIATLERLHQEYEICSGKSLKREEYHKMLVEIIRETKITGLGAKDVLLYLFGVPFITLFIKQSVIPQAIPNYIFVPAVTSATVFLLAKLHMI
ncbi:uncharacterized protein [Solanum lycopersicum]|nr:uncharacterized protein LOC101256163 [Solanum lycopersicum]TMW85534.1 hypothetical protein EJD97_022985 [Solanum chilense]